MNKFAKFLIVIVILAWVSATDAQSLETAKSFYKACQSNLSAKDYEQYILCFDENDRANMNVVLTGMFRIALQANQVDPGFMQEVQEVFDRYPEKDIGDVEINSSADATRAFRMINTDEGTLAKSTVIMKLMAQGSESGGVFEPFDAFIHNSSTAQLSGWSEVEDGVVAKFGGDSFNFRWDGLRWWLTGVWTLQQSE